MYVYVVDSQFQFKAKNLIKGLGDHVIFFLMKLQVMQLYCYLLIAFQR